MAEECTESGVSIAITMLMGAIFGAGILAMMLGDCKKKTPKMRWLKIGAQ